MATVVLGVAGLATQAGLWYADYARLQTAADAAATAGAVGIAAGESSAQYMASANYVLQQNGFASGQGGVTVTINAPPATGPHAGNSSAVEVLLTAPTSLSFTRLFLATAPTLHTRSVAMYQASNATCVLALSGTITMSGGAQLNANGCTVGTNNTGSNAVSLSGGAALSAYTVVSAGGIQTDGGASMSLTKPQSSNHVATADPLAALQGLALPPSRTFSPASCNPVTFANPNSTTTLAPGTYCAATVAAGNTLDLSGGSYVFNGGIAVSGSGALNIAGAATTLYVNGDVNVSGSSPLNIAPGTYFINNGSLIVTGGGSLGCGACSAGGTGASFVLMGGNPGTMQISGGAPVSFSAPASSNYNAALNGVAIYEVPADNGTNTLSGSGTLSVQGAVYTPGAALDISGGAGTSSATCLFLVAASLTLTGSGNASNTNCTNYGYTWAGNASTPNGVTLVE